MLCLKIGAHRPETARVRQKILQVADGAPDLRIVAALLFLSVFSGAGTAQSEMRLQFSAANRFVSVHGRRAWAGGNANGGLEIWAGALQIASDVRPEFRREGDISTFTAAHTVADVAVEPEQLSRTYIGPDFAVREDIRAAPEQAAVLIRFTVRAVAPVQIIVRFRPSLNLMWPAAIGGQSTHWDSAHSAYILTEPTREFGAVVLAPGASAHDEPLNNMKRWNPELAIALDPHTPQILFAPMSSLPAETLSDGELSALNHLLASDAGEQQSLTRYRDLLASNAQIETPEPDLNRALAWAEVDLDQEWFCSERLGCGFVAGFGPSRQSRRPQYAWFFAGDGMVALRAALNEGDFPHARDELKFISKYQNQDGMIWHELSLSAPYLDWPNKYPYMFVHADLTYPYISSVADYVRRSNDLELLRQLWPSVQKAFTYGASLLGSDKLPRIPAGKLGADEQNPLTDELGLSAAWISACEDYAFLSDLMGQRADGSNAMRLASAARAAFPLRYWNSRENTSIQGYTRDGTAVPDRGLGAVESAQLHVFSETQLHQMLEQLASWRFQSDWGTRSLPVGDTGYNPTGYVQGSVSAIHTANVARAFWERHHPETAFQIWHSLIPWFWLDSPGHMHELLQGNVYMPQSESVPEQTWSSAAFLSAAWEGLFGLSINAEAGLITLAPHLPATWDQATLRSVPVGKANLTFSFKQSSDRLTLHIENPGEPVQLLYSPALPLGARDVTAKDGTQMLPVHVAKNEQDLHAVLHVEIPHGGNDIEVNYKGGISLVARNDSDPIVGEPSSSLKLISLALDGDVLHLGVDLVGERSNRLEIITDRTIANASNALLNKLSPDTYEISIQPLSPTSDTKYQHEELAIHFDSEKKPHR
jgi:hypothetical protein